LSESLFNDSPSVILGEVVNDFPDSVVVASRSILDRANRDIARVTESASDATVAALYGTAARMVVVDVGRGRFTADPAQAVEALKQRRFHFRPSLSTFDLPEPNSY
jgi:hypothetical protein